MTKRVIVQMKDSCHALLKQYAVFHGWTMSDAMYEAARHRIHTHAATNPRVRSLLELHGKALDPRVEKSCYGPECYSCGMFEACRDGDHSGLAPHLSNDVSL